MPFLERFHDVPFVFTMVRDPIDRALSSYAGARSRPISREPQVLLPDQESAAYERAREYRRLAREYSVSELIGHAPEVATEFFGNRQARPLCSRGPAIGEEDLDDALEGLERCDFVGLTQRLGESADWLAKRLGWRPLQPIPRSNVSPMRIQRDQIPGEVIQALGELCPVDRALHDHAASRYERDTSGWERESDPRDPSTRIPDAPAVADLRFDEPVPGGGWLAREHVPGGPVFCWMGSENRGWVDLADDGAANSLRIEIPHAIAPEILQSLRVSINGDRLVYALAQADGVVAATAPLPAGRKEGGTMRVELEVDRSIRPRDIDPDSADDRALSVAVSRVAIRCS